MTARQRIEKQISEVKARVSAFAALENPDDAAREKYRADAKALEALHEQHAAAITAEGNPVDDGEGRERNGLAERASISRYMAAAPSGRLDGVEAEYNAALEIPDTDGNGVRVPLAMLAPADGEQYADAHTNVAGDTRAAERSWADRLFAQTVLGWAGVRRDSVPSGVASYPITTSGPAAADVDKGADVDAVALQVRVDELKPRRIGAGITLTAEDSIRVPGLEPALRRDLREALMTGIEKYHVETITGALTALQLGGAADAALTAQSTGAEFVAALTGAVDGLHAHTVGVLDGRGGSSGIKVFGAPEFETWLRSSVVTYGTTDTEPLDVRLMKLGVAWRWTDHLGEISGQAGQAYAYLVLPVMIADAVACPVWDSFSLIVDPYTQAAAGRTAYRAAAFTACHVRRPGNILARRVQLAA